MHHPYFRNLMRAPYTKLFVSLRCAALGMMLSSCSSALPVLRDVQQVEGAEPSGPYSIVCVIHGDGDYLYHDTDGNKHEADENALAAVMIVAQRNPLAEVFVFHRKPRRHFLLVFPQRDGEFYYFRNGRLVANEAYWRDEGQTPFDPEADLYRRFRASDQHEKVNFFLYFGHEVPEFGGTDYDASYPDRPFTLHDLAAGMQGFTADSTKFDLMVFATCFGGTPFTIEALGSSARYIIASPENLHLSYFNLSSLDRLDLHLQDGDIPAFAGRFARQAFDRLTGEVQTAVTLAVYDVERAQPYTRSVASRYHQTLAALERESQSSIAAIGRCDCADLPPYALSTINDGVDILHRPAQFGRSKNKQSHSGWECWKEKVPQAATYQIVEPVLK